MLCVSGEMAEWTRHLLMSRPTPLLVEGETADLEEGPVAERVAGFSQDDLL